MKKLCLITLSCLVILTVKAFAHPQPEDMTEQEHIDLHHEELEAQQSIVERIENLEKKDKQQDEKDQNIQNQVNDLKADQDNEDQRDKEERQDEAIADGASPIPYGPTIAKWVIRKFKEQFSKCAGPCAKYGYEPREHFRICKAGDEY